MIQSFPRYKYTGFQWESLLAYVDFSEIPLVRQRIINAFCEHFSFLETTPSPASTLSSSSSLPASREEASSQKEQERRTLEVNHVIGTLYKDADDYIGYHNDKTEDIAEATPILLLSFGETREFHLRDNATGKVQVVVVKEGDLFILGPKTNDSMKHSIATWEDERRLRRQKPEVGQRLSIVMREIATVYSREGVLQEVARARAEKIQRKKRKEKKKRAKDLKRVKAQRAEDESFKKHKSE